MAQLGHAHILVWPLGITYLYNLLFGLKVLLISNTQSHCAQESHGKLPATIHPVHAGSPECNQPTPIIWKLGEPDNLYSPIWCMVYSHG